MKQRSGLSHEALAKRAHTSTSTPHRYCKGDGAPADSAAVSRFGRVCKEGDSRGAGRAAPAPSAPAAVRAVPSASTWSAAPAGTGWRRTDPRIPTPRA
ncbi:helix-turn-helix domain-containing protein [Streptomyces actinomycinicus]|uniref:helix-turn-helix domain-containing protein n=1 Tax=Streptomyces actinomycinicus TaxID=1695166 RepID=UPI001F41AD91|nr:helix-turn-helix transcriptional regulator [Streptomyces actinomycinicus]